MMENPERARGKSILSNTGNVFPCTLYYSHEEASQNGGCRDDPEYKFLKRRYTVNLIIKEEGKGERCRKFESPC